MDHSFYNTKRVVKSDTSLANIFCNSKTIIDDTFISSNHILALLHYFSCVAQVFTKYRFSFKLIKCNFFLLRVEYVGHDLTVSGNCPAQSKFKLIKDWLFYHVIYLLSPSLGYVLSTVIMFHGLNLILNHLLAFNVYIIVTVYHYLLGHLCLSIYSKDAKWTSLLHLFYVTW